MQQWSACNCNVQSMISTVLKRESDRCGDLSIPHQAQKSQTNGFDGSIWLTNHRKYILYASKRNAIIIFKVKHFKIDHVLECISVYNTKQIWERCAYYLYAEFCMFSLFRVNKVDLFTYCTWKQQRCIQSWIVTNEATVSTKLDACYGLSLICALDWMSSSSAPRNWKHPRPVVDFSLITRCFWFASDSQLGSACST